jgi:hypothetical protein
MQPGGPTILKAQASLLKLFLPIGGEDWKGRVSESGGRGAAECQAGNSLFRGFRPRCRIGPRLKIHCKNVIVFPAPSWDVTNQTLSDQELLNYSRPVSVWLVTSRLGTGKTKNFLQCMRHVKLTSFWSILADLSGP